MTDWMQLYSLRANLWIFPGIQMASYCMNVTCRTQTDKYIRHIHHKCMNSQQGWPKEMSWKERAHSKLGRQMKVKGNQEGGVCHYLNTIVFFEPNSTDRSCFPRDSTSRASKLRSHLGRNISFLWHEQLGGKDEQTFALGARGAELNAHHLLEMMMYCIYT